MNWQYRRSNKRVNSHYTRSLLTPQNIDESDWLPPNQYDWTWPWTFATQRLQLEPSRSRRTQVTNQRCSKVRTNAAHVPTHVRDKVLFHCGLSDTARWTAHDPTHVSDKVLFHCGLSDRTAEQEVIKSFMLAEFLKNEFTVADPPQNNVDASGTKRCRCKWSYLSQKLKVTCRQWDRMPTEPLRLKQPWTFETHASNHSTMQQGENQRRARSNTCFCC